MKIDKDGKLLFLINSYLCYDGNFTDLEIMLLAIKGIEGRILTVSFYVSPVIIKSVPLFLLLMSCSKRVIFMCNFAIKNM